jgi:hypothetical protein
MQALKKRGSVFATLHLEKIKKTIDGAAQKTTDSGKLDFLQARTSILGTGLHRFARWPKPVVFSRAWCEANRASGLNKGRNAAAQCGRRIIWLYWQFDPSITNEIWRKRIRTGR